jgi:hypothetical protein
MGLVDDEQRVTALASQVVERGAELGKQAGEAERRFDLQGQEDLMIEGDDAQVRVGEIDDGVEVAVEGMSESADGSGFAGTDVAGDEGGETLLKGKGQATLNFTMAAGRKEVFGGHRPGERGVAKGIEIIETGHGVHPPQER